MSDTCTIIAEAGVNHNGDIKLAFKLIDEAAKAGVDFVKFQTWKSENVISCFAEKAEYQKETTGSSESMLDMERKLELPYSDFYDLKAYCKEKGVGFMSTPFDIESVEFLFELGVDILKIPSGEINNLPFLEAIASHGRQRLILSTGMSDMEEIQQALEVLKPCGEIVLLQCNTQYPTPMKDVNLRSMQTMRERFSVPVGLSDHSVGIEVSIAAVALGACVIEKHFTLDRKMEGPDHKASIDPKELYALVPAIRNVELALGNGQKTVSDSERENLAVARKSIVAQTAIGKGSCFTVDNITTKRPGNGISPMRWHKVLGTQAKRDFLEDELIEL